MDEDTTLYGSRSRPRPHCIRPGPSSPRKGHIAAPLFGTCLLWSWSPISATAGLLFTICYSLNFLDHGPFHLIIDLLKCDFSRNCTSDDDHCCRTDEKFSDYCREGLYNKNWHDFQLSQYHGTSRDPFAEPLGKFQDPCPSYGTGESRQFKLDHGKLAY